MTKVDIFASVLNAAGLILFAGGAITFIENAFHTRKSLGWLCLLLPPAGVVYLIKNWHETKKSFYIMLGGAAVLLVSFAVFFFNTPHFYKRIIIWAWIIGSCGGILIMAGIILFIIDAFRAHKIWGLVCWIAPLVLAGIIFLVLHFMKVNQLWQWSCPVIIILGPVIFSHFHWHSAKYPLFVMAGGAALVPLAVTLAVFLPDTSPLYKEALTYVETILPPIVNDWNYKELSKRATPDFLKSCAEDELKNRFEYFAQLGKVKTIYPPLSKNQPNAYQETASNATFTFVTTLECEKGKAFIVFQIVQAAKGWLIDGFLLDTQDLQSYPNYIASREAAKKLVEEAQRAPKIQEPPPKKPAVAEEKKEPPEAAYNDTPQGIKAFLKDMKITGASSDGAIINGKYYKIGEDLEPKKILRLVSADQKKLVFEDKQGNLHKKIPFQTGGYNY